MQKNFIPSYPPLDELEGPNRDARFTLANILHSNGVNVAAEHEDGERSPRGLAFFYAFDPWTTSLRCPQSSVGFFSAARKNHLISDAEAIRLENALVEIAVRIAAKYKGPFEKFFKIAKVNQILNVRERSVMAQAGLPVPENWVDSLFEACPFPLHPDRHLAIQNFDEIRTATEVEFYSKSPWLSWTEALDLVCLGPWAGLSPASILNMVEALEERESATPPKPVRNSFVGQKVTLPVNSRGLQGVVFGFFRDPPAQKTQIFQSLLQFGGALADVYADLRWTRFVETLRNGELTELEIAREVINVVSPVSKVVVQRGTQSAGYKILEQEAGYWGGYEELSKSELTDPPSKTRFEVGAPGGLRIFIELLSGWTSLDPEFAEIRLKSNLECVFEQITPAQNEIVLPEKEVDELLSRFQGIRTGSRSVPKLRKYYVIEAVRQNWRQGGVRITNSALKTFLEKELNHDVGSGYQITSFIPEAEGIFGGKVKVTKESNNSIFISWNPGVYQDTARLPA
jgi:hypothetical protein